MEVVGKPQSHWICFNNRRGCSFQPDGCRVAEPGDPQEWSRRETRHQRRPFPGKGWRRAFPAEQMSPGRADAAAEGDSRRAGERLPCWLPISPLSPSCIPPWINVQENPAPGLLLQEKCQGKSAGGCSLAAVLGAWDGVDLGAEIWAVLAARAASTAGTICSHTDPSQPSSSLSLQGCSKQTGIADPTGFYIPAGWEHLATRCHQALLVGHMSREDSGRYPGMLCSPRGEG